MTAQTTVTYSDDLGSSGAATPLVFSIGDKSYEIHLNKRNMETFMRRMGTYTSVARTPEAPAVPIRSRRQVRENTAAVRAWEIAKGYKISTKGRIPSEITAAYEAR